MIISWFTDPSKGTFSTKPRKFSSYYQYDTETKHFTRIRLELDRTVKAHDAGDTQGMYKKTRYVGFSDVTNLPTDQTDWSFNEDDQLVYNGDVLKSTPSPNDRTYDWSGKDTVKVHRGTPVTDSPNLPEGIEPKHLSLIANQTFISKDKFTLTKGNASVDDLSKALKSKVSGIMGGKDFDKITNEEILEKLKSQVGKIRAIETKSEKDSLDKSVTDVEESLNKLEETITERGSTPDMKFETAIENARKVVESAKTAKTSGDIKKSLSDLKEARTSLDGLEWTVEENSILQAPLQKSKDALDDVLKAGEDWTKAQESYENLEESKSLETYESEIDAIPEVEDTVVSAVE